MADILTSEPSIRLGFFLSILVLMAVWEGLAPRRVDPNNRLLRWPSNLGIVVLNSLLIRVLFPAGVVGLAYVEGQHGWGLFNMMSLPSVVTIIISVIVLDLTLYLQHVLFHAIPLLWRVHRMHHSDLFFDVTTGVRFHPFEILLSLGFKFIVVVALGPPAMAVLVFEVLLNATSMFNHGNVWIREDLDRFLRWLVVTPDMHRVHHSASVPETNSNFGFNLSWWDRVFGTYCPQPADGQDGMTIGIGQFRCRKELRLDRMLCQPFLGRVGAYPMSRRKELEG